MRARRKLHQYHRLWMESVVSDEDSGNPADHLIDEVCMKLKNTDDFEQYVHTLCDGLIFLLRSRIRHSKLSEHRELRAYIDQMADKIIENSHLDSDLMYLGILVELEHGKNIWEVKFYQMIKNLLAKILDSGQKIGAPMRQKLRTLLKMANPMLYTHLFSSNSA